MSYDIETLTSTDTSTDSGMTDFKECLRHLRDRNLEEALVFARRALEAVPKNPFYLSYVGLLAARAERRFGEGERLCVEAVGIRHNHPQLYLNLAEVYHNAGRMQEAVDTLRKGLISTGRDSRIRQALKKIGARRNPVISFLHRDHSLNRVLGKWRHRLLSPPEAPSGAQ